MPKAEPKRKAEDVDPKEEVKRKKTSLKDFFVSPTKNPAPDTTTSSSTSTSEEEFRDLLSELIIPEDGSLKTRVDFDKCFEKIAGLLLNNSLLYIKGEAHRISEIEFYYKGEGHVDTFTHCDEFQKEAGQWYFHRQGKHYKSGTYKGLDITFGRPGPVDASKPPVFGGILIRAIEPINSDKLTEGPCLVVDYILKKTGYATIDELVKSPNFSLQVGLSKDTPKNSPLYISLQPSASIVTRRILRSARVGLSMKTKPKAEQPEEYVMRPYRFLAGDIGRWKKGRNYLVPVMLENGLEEEVYSKLKMKPAMLQTWKDAISKGREMSGDAFYLTKVENIDLLHLFGFCLKNAGP